MTNKRKHLVIVAMSVVALVVVATAAAISGDQSPPPSQPIAYVPTSSTAATTPASQGLVSALAGLTGTAIESMRLGNPPAGVVPPSHAPWLYITVRAPGTTNGLDIKSMWEADLVEGVVADGATTTNDVIDGLSGSSFNIALPDGSTAEVPGGIGDIAHGQQFSEATTAEVTSALNKSLGANGLTLISITVLRPNGPAPAVVASTQDVAQTLAHYGNLLKALFGNPPTYEGYYFELQDGLGNVIARSSASFRSGAGRFWIDPKWRSSEVGVYTLGLHTRKAGR